MKKLITRLLTAFLVVFSMAIMAQAEGTTINETFFPGGKITTPAAPYVHYVDKYDDGTPCIGSTEMFFDIPEDLLALNNELALMGEEAFNEKYNTPMRGDYHDNLQTQIQIDTKFDDGPWLSESANWDRFDYGEEMYSSNLNYRLAVGRYVDETSKLFSFEQSWLIYNEDNEANAFLQPYLKSFKDDYDEVCYQLDTENHTFSYRVRFVLTTDNWEAGEDEEEYWCYSDWSPVVSIGKNGNQETLEKPTKVDAPVLSDFSLIKTEENGVEAQYYVDFSKYTYDSIKYYSVIEDYFGPFYIESQIRVDGGEWVDTYTANAADLSGGYRSTGSEDVEITMDSQVEIRIRIICSAMDETASEWSNIVGNKADGEVVPTTGAQGTKGDNEVVTETNTEKHKCKVCGICPIQPLGICLFIWIAIIIIVIIIVVILLSSKKKKDKDEKKKK